MKKLLLFLTALVMISCADKSMYTYDEFKAAQYNAAFTQRYGQIDPNHTWGFGSITTRSANTNANEWGKTWDCVPNVNLTADELAELKELLSPGKETYNTDIFPYENYWVSQVYKGQAPNEEYTATDRDGAATGTKVTGSQQMDKIVARNGSNYEHVNNFNYGNNTNSVYDQNFTDPNTGSHNHIGTTLMIEMSLDDITATNQFGFHESFSNADYNNYLIVYYKGYWYVGFDYEMHKDVNNPGEAKDVNRDWCFTDWIVRITPAYAKGTTPEVTPPQGVQGITNGRIICEDLGATDDFDFNDVVFDAVISNGKTTITLLAAGGTLPLTVAGHEVHEEFGVETNVMVNTGMGANITPVTFEVDDDFGGSIANIPVIVTIEATEYNTSYELKNTIGSAPKKICVDTDYVWTTERQQIEDKYPGFKSYVGNSNLKWY